MAIKLSNRVNYNSYLGNKRIFFFQNGGKLFNWRPLTVRMKITIPFAETMKSWATPP